MSFRWETCECMSFPHEGLAASLTHPCRCAIRHLWLQLFFVLLPIVLQMVVLIECSWQRTWLPCALEYSIWCSHGQWWSMLGFMVGRPCGGMLDDAWSSSLPNFVFLVSSRIDTGPVLWGNVANGIACPWPLTPWAEFCLWVVHWQANWWFGWGCMFVDVPFPWVCVALRPPFWHWWTMLPVWPLQLMTSLPLFSARYLVLLHCWWGCPPCLPWTCGHRLCFGPWVQIGTMCRCVLRVSYRLLGKWRLCALVMLSSLKIASISPLSFLWVLLVWAQWPWAWWALSSQQLTQDTEIPPWPPEWISFLLYQGMGRCWVGSHVGLFHHTSFWHAGVADPVVQ